MQKLDRFQDRQHTHGSRTLMRAARLDPHHGYTRGSFERPLLAGKSESKQQTGGTGHEPRPGDGERGSTDKTVITALEAAAWHIAGPTEKEIRVKNDE